MENLGEAAEEEEEEEDLGRGLIEKYGKKDDLRTRPELRLVGLWSTRVSFRVVGDKAAEGLPA